MGVINLGLLDCVEVPVPSLSEQAALLKELQAAHIEHKQLQDVLAAQIDHLVEYRQALILAAVTGQLDLSKEAA